MFTTHFHMSSQPFCEKIPVEHIIKDERMTQGLARIQYMLHQGTLALIYGQTGVGKSTLIKLLLEQLPQNQYFPLYVHFTHVKASSLFTLIVTQLGEMPKRTKERLFLQIMEKITHSNLTIFLIIDEAHLLCNDAITDLRLLTSSPLDDSPPLKILLSGQESLKNTLKRDSLSDFAQRISVHYHLNLLTKAQTTAYIDSQMNYANATDKIFEQEVKDIIYDFSGGIPRKINNIATACLINAYIQKSQKINLNIVQQAIAEFQLF